MKISFPFFPRFLKAQKGLHNKSGYTSNCVFTTPVKVAGHKHNLTFFQGKEKYAVFYG